MLFLPVWSALLQGPAASLRVAGGRRGLALYTTCTPARLGLSVGWAYRSRLIGIGKLWSSPNGESGPAASLVSSVSGGPPSTDWPHGGSTRWAFLDLRLTIVPPSRECTARCRSGSSSPARYPGRITPHLHGRD